MIPSSRGDANCVETRIQLVRGGNSAMAWTHSRRQNSQCVVVDNEFRRRCYHRSGGGGDKIRAQIHAESDGLSGRRSYHRGDRDRDWNRRPSARPGLSASSGADVARHHRAVFSAWGDILAGCPRNQRKAWGLQVTIRTSLVRFRAQRLGRPTPESHQRARYALADLYVVFRQHKHAPDAPGGAAGGVVFLLLGKSAVDRHQL
jgi:hypothetical protein